MRSCPGSRLVIADAFGGTIRRDAPTRAVNATRKRAQLLRFALAASERLHPNVRSRRAGRADIAVRDYGRRRETGGAPQ